MTRPRTILVIEDGTEYVDAMRSLAPSDAVELVSATDVDEARRALAGHGVDGVFLDVVFDRIPPEKLTGDRGRGDRHLAENQGFYLLSELAPLLPDGIPVVIAYDFSAEPERLAALREKHANLSGVADGTPMSEVFEALTSGGTPGGLS